jgi:hypothetical protein
MMTKEEVFHIWAPPNTRWSSWVKPVLFAAMDRPPPPFTPDPPEWEVDWAPPVDRRMAIVLDLPGAGGVAAGLSMAMRGYRPVPLYNAVAGPLTFAMSGGISLIDVSPVVTALWLGAERLVQLALSPEAPPVFLLDANRRGEGLLAAPGRFDNRSISFVTDFPSANFLLTHGIERARLVQNALDEPQPDLAHTLRRWQEGGVTIELQRLDAPGPARVIEVHKPSGFGRLWHRALSILGLRRHALGGFGGFIPEASSG